MGLPLVFALGLLVVLIEHELVAPVPGSGQPTVLAEHALVLAVPALLALLSAWLLRRRLLHGSPPFAPPRALLRLSAIATPIALYVVLVPGGWLDLARTWAGDGFTLGIALAVAPLYVTELPRILFANLAGTLAEVDREIAGRRTVSPELLPRLAEVWPTVRLLWSWPLLLTVPSLLLGGALDLLRLDRQLLAFVLGTSPGYVAAAVVLLLVFAVVLPPWFRVAFGVRDRLPEPLGSRLRGVAASLDFVPPRVLLLDTDMRAINAMMVGPLPVGRFLALTDALIKTLDEDSLAGVVAHEVGHARMGHPGILMVMAVAMPMLLATPVRVLGFTELATTTQAVLLLVLTLLGWAAVRRLAHRFEHEADAASVLALGAGPCSRALHQVGRAGQPSRRGVVGRVLTLHPEESVRIAAMWRYQSDPAYRQAFAATGARLRRLVGAALVGALALAAWSWRVEWPYERALWRFQVGDYVAAQQLRVELDADVPERWFETWSVFRAELDAARSLAPEATDWQTAAPALRAGAWPRAVEVMLAEGPAAARPWLDLAVAAEDAPSLQLRAIAAFADAAADHDPDRMAAAKAVVQRLGVPERLRPVFAD